MTPAQVEAIRKDLGLDGPPYVRYARWLGLQPIVAAVTGEKAVSGVLEGNLGFTLSTRRPVIDELVPRIGPTLLLMLASVVLAVLIGIPFGVISAVKQYGKLDYVLTSVTMVLISTPTFVLGLILIYLLGVSLRLLPIGGMQTLGKPFSYADLAGHMADARAHPGLRLRGAADALHASQHARGAQQRIRDHREGERGWWAGSCWSGTACAMPSSRSSRWWGCSCPTSSPERSSPSRSSRPGMGLLAVRAASQRDPSLMMGIVLLIAVAVLTANIITDVVYTYADPRIRLVRS